MAILKNIGIIFLLLSLSGCYECFIPEEIDTTPVLCVNSLVTVGEPVEVKVTHSWPRTEPGGLHQVDDAEVWVFANDLPADDDYVAAEGDKVRITVHSARYGDAEAEVEVPASAPVSEPEWEAEVTDRRKWMLTESTTYEFLLNLRVSMTITDPAYIENFYHFAYDTFVEGGDTEVVWGFHVNFYYEAEPIFSEHVGLIDEISGNDGYGFYFFTDRQFSGKSYTLTLQFRDMSVYVADDFTPEGLPDFGLRMSVDAVSKSYYDWSLYQWNAGSGIIGELADSGLGEPLWGYSNVSTSAGVVAARTPASRTVSIRDLILDELEHISE